MAKKAAVPKSPSRTRTARPSTRTSKTAEAAPVDTIGVTGADLRATADDAGAVMVAASPSADEIARAAYLRYLGRGARDGHDFDDWIEAERALAGAGR